MNWVTFIMKRNKKSIKESKKRNVIASDLFKPKYHQRIVNSKKNYNRKEILNGRLRREPTDDDLSS